MLMNVNVWILMGGLAAFLGLAGCKRGGTADVAGLESTARGAGPPPAVTNWNMKDKVQKSEDVWARELTPEQFRVLRKEGTERAFTGAYWNNHEPGVYRCAGCGLDLFSSEAKFDSGTGWPSFWQPIESGHIETQTDRKFFMSRTEVRCPRCGGHLGHVFDDGPAPTGLRYCINSAALTFEPATKASP